MSKQSIGSVFGILLVVLLALAGCSAPVSESALVAVRGAVGDTNVTNLVADGNVTVGGDLSIAGECVGCGGGTTIEILDDIPTLSASQPMTVTELAFGTGKTITEGEYGVAFNSGAGLASYPLSIGVDPEDNVPYIGYDYLTHNGTYIRFDDDNQQLIVNAGDLVLRGLNQLTLDGPVMAAGFSERPLSYPVSNGESVTLRTDENGALVSQTYANGSAAVTLPELEAGLHYCFFVRTGGSMTIDPAGTNKIDTLTDAAGDRISNSVAGSSICLQAWSSAAWIPYSISGTWADAN